MSSFCECQSSTPCAKHGPCRDADTGVPCSYCGTCYKPRNGTPNVRPPIQHGDPLNTVHAWNVTCPLCRSSSIKARVNHVEE